MEGNFFKVGEFEVDPRTNQIYRDGVVTMLPPRLMDLLCFFHERNGAPARGAPCIENMH